LKTSDFDYSLPERAIAQTPVEPRDAARLLVMNRRSGAIQHAQFKDLGEYLNPGDLLVLNQTRVIPARLYARKIGTKGRVEILLLKPHDERKWEAIVGGRRVRPGLKLLVENKYEAEIHKDLGGSRRVIMFMDPIDEILKEAGKLPLPPYIRSPISDPDRYQTVYAEISGSVAAPTAGLHFTPNLMARLKSKGVRFATVTLHIGLDTFAPVTEDLAEKHPIHREWCEVPKEAAEAVNRTHRAGKRIVTVGTTSVRAMETAAFHAQGEDAVGEFVGYTDLFILPGYQFKVVDGLITNFHLPKTTLLMLVSAFASRDQVIAAYGVALESGYRFYSFGDAMFIQ
jgi:S-adenosylmethionine:tRNA ribosyltransferase-isomerase